MPYVLNCAHTLCHTCTQGIKKTDNKTGVVTWRCPSCQAVTGEKPKQNFALRDLLPALFQMRTEPTPPAALCEECAAAPATLWCQNCEATMCQSCADATHAPKVMQRHIRFPLAERAKSQGPPKCAIHGEVLKYMYLDCQK